MSEKDWIARYFATLVKAEGAVGLTDDVALLAQSDRPQIVTTDAIVEGMHFLPSDPIETVARKLVRVNVSDILAKGAAPFEALLTLGWPEARGEDELQKFAEALGAELAKWHISLIGGDTVQMPGRVFASLMLTGSCHAKAPIRRSGAKIGDAVWVSGEIGRGALGLVAAKGDAQYLSYLDHYRTPDLPPIEIAELIARHGHGSCDISDGLLGDADAISMASEAAIEIDLGSIPLARSPKDLPEMLHLASAGDDYQCLFTAPESAQLELAQWSQRYKYPLTRIGHVTDGTGLTVLHNGVRVNLPETLGFEHGA